MKKEVIIDHLSNYNPQEVERFASYIIRLSTELDKNNKLKNPWLQKRTEKEMAVLFERVANEGLVFDGVHITLQSTGICYDHIAYKNKMLLAYPETKMDWSVVYNGDTFYAEKKDGTVLYEHKIGSPFTQKDKDVVGAYCVIRNSRGEFITTLSIEDVNKHRKVAKTDYIWQSWFKEMVEKTIIKKACKKHFDDVYEKINDMDNENYDIENPVGITLDHKQALESINSLEELKTYYELHKGNGADFVRAVTKRKNEIEKSVIVDPEDNREPTSDKITLEEVENLMKN